MCTAKHVAYGAPRGIRPVQCISAFVCICTCACACVAVCVSVRTKIHKYSYFNTYSCEYGFL